MRKNWTRCKEPHHITFFICLILFIVALLAHFGVLRFGIEPAIWSWSWIIGFGLLLLAVRVKGL